MRLGLVAAAVLLAAVPTVPAAHPAAQPPGDSAAPAEKDRVKMDDETKKTVDRALSYLKDQQQRDGGWGNTAITSFALLAFMANGHVPNQGVYGDVVFRGVQHLLAQVRDNPNRRDDGYLVGDRGGNMYCHGMATLCLTQVYGMTGDKDVRAVLKKAVDLIVRTQSREGGWRYDPTPDAGADISVTIMQVMALRGAKDSGLHVKDETTENALKYIRRCYDDRSGGFKYQPYSSGPGYARSAAGLCLVYLCGKDQDERNYQDGKPTFKVMCEQATDYLVRTGDDNGHYWYGHYYACHALNQVGGKVWEDYYERMKRHLLATQKSDPRVPDKTYWYESRREAQYGPAYQTAIAVLILSVPTHYLPIYQK
jgi:hypothetical protein